MYLIVGLGNPGANYFYNRHNLGYLVADFIVEKLRFSPPTQKFQSFVHTGQIAGNKTLLIKPQTYMNNSGQAVQAAAAYFKIPTSRIIIIYDDIDLAFGTLRLRNQGSAGTHNGMKSVVTCFGNDQIPRLRLGIGPAPANIDLASFVLSDFGVSEEQALPAIYQTATDKICEWLTKEAQPK